MDKNKMEFSTKDIVRKCVIETIEELGYRIPQHILDGMYQVYIVEDGGISILLPGREVNEKTLCIISNEDKRVLRANNLICMGEEYVYLGKNGEVAQVERRNIPPEVLKILDAENEV